jgi:uncharacterized protein
MVDVSRLREVLRGGRPPARELTYVPLGAGEVDRRAASPEFLAAGLGGSLLETPFGACLLVERAYEAWQSHGREIVAGGEGIDNDGFGFRLLENARPGARRAAAPAGRRIVFLDLETTGLSGGAGTVAFLVGCGFFDAGRFLVRQFVLPAFAAERALLAAVAMFAGEVCALVTFNGKTFDLPVMETRWLFHRMSPPFEGMRHLDMLHPARRLWRPPGVDASGDGRVGCRLVELERSVLGFHRVGDVPGWEIPGRYFHYLRTGGAAPLVPVLEHNRLDLLSLALLAARAVRLIESGSETARDAAECLALGRLYERAGAVDRAAACFDRAARDGEARVRALALQRLALRYRRDRRHAESAASWQQALLLDGEAGAIGQQALEALAIHHEHRARDLAAARDVARRALAGAADRRRREALGYRLARLEKKMATPPRAARPAKPRT